MAETVKFTAGPWLIAGATHVYAPGEAGANICSVGEPRATTSVRYTELQLGSKDFGEACANARLIAATPELLEVLTALVWVCDDPNGSESGKSLALALSEKLPAARAAIAKATQP